MSDYSDISNSVKGHWGKLYEFYALRNRMGMLWPIVHAHLHAEHIMNPEASTTVREMGDSEGLLHVDYIMSCPGGGNRISFTCGHYPLSVFQRYCDRVLGRTAPYWQGKGEVTKPLTWSKYILDKQDKKFKRDWIKTFQLNEDMSVPTADDWNSLNSMMSSMCSCYNVFDNCQVEDWQCEEMATHLRLLKKLAVFGMLDVLYYYITQC